MIIFTLYLRQKLGSLQSLSSKTGDDFLFSFQTTAVTDDVKTIRSMVSICAHASITFCAALTSTSTTKSCKYFENLICFTHFDITNICQFKKFPILLRVFSRRCTFSCIYCLFKKFTGLLTCCHVQP